MKLVSRRDSMMTAGTRHFDTKTLILCKMHVNFFQIKAIMHRLHFDLIYRKNINLELRNAISGGVPPKNRLRGENLEDSRTRT
jgi:hypothetical protein